MQVNMHTAKTELSRLIEQALSGQDVVIARDGTPVARLVPIRQGTFQFGLLADRVGSVPDFTEPMDAGELDLWDGRE